jgi:hypothetical protein
MHPLFLCRSSPPIVIARQRDHTSLMHGSHGPWLISEQASCQGLKRFHSGSRSTNLQRLTLAPRIAPIRQIFYCPRMCGICLQESSGSRTPQRSHGPSRVLATGTIVGAGVTTHPCCMISYVRKGGCVLRIHNRLHCPGVGPVQESGSHKYIFLPALCSIYCCASGPFEFRYI